MDNEEQDEHHRNSSRVPTRERSYRYSSVAEVQMVQQRRPVTVRNSIQQVGSCS